MLFDGPGREPIRDSRRRRRSGRRPRDHRRVVFRGRPARHGGSRGERPARPVRARRRPHRRRRRHLDAGTGRHVRRRRRGTTGHRGGQRRRVERVQPGDHSRWRGALRSASDPAPGREPRRPRPSGCRHADDRVLPRPAIRSARRRGPGLSVDRIYRRAVAREPGPNTDGDGRRRARAGRCRPPGAVAAVRPETPRGTRRRRGECALSRGVCSQPRTDSRALGVGYREHRRRHRDLDAGTGDGSGRNDARATGRLGGKPRRQRSHQPHARTRRCGSPGTAVGREPGSRSGSGCWRSPWPSSSSWPGPTLRCRARKELS